MEKRIEDGILNAMKSKDETRLETLRSIKTAFQMAKTAPGASHELSETDCIAIVQKLAKQRTDSIEQYRSAGRNDLADKEQAELDILTEFIPEPLSEDNVENIVLQIINELGATSMKDMGRVMKEATEDMKGRADGKTISTIVRKLLQK